MIKGEGALLGFTSQLVRPEMNRRSVVSPLFHLLKLPPLAATHLEKSEKTENFISKNR
jgi:hypothetical protein